MPIENRTTRQPIFVVGPSIAYIPLTKGLFAVVDVEDAEELSRYNWCTHRGRGDCFYAKRSDGIRMHRFVLPSSEPKCDHRNGNGLHNFKGNLRPCSDTENLCNRGAQKNSSTGIKGVSYHSTGRIRARINVNGKCHPLGYFDTLQEAASAYAAAASKLHGEFACTGREQ